MEKYGLMVIGGGTAGLATALLASKMTKTVLIDPKTLGGTCLNSGCIPTKAMLHASHLYKLSNEMKQYGFSTTPKLNFRKLMDRVNGIVKSGVDHIYAGLKKNKNLTVIRAKASFINHNIVKAGSKKVRAQKIIIATGAKNFVPPIKGIKSIGYLDNETILGLKKLPKSVVMIGGGYIAMEFATFFHQLGCNVTVLELFPNILGALDEDISNGLKQHYISQGMKIVNNANIIQVKKSKGKKVVIYNDVRDKESKKVQFNVDEIVLATGRLPNTDGLNLDKAGINLGKRNIAVNRYLQTTNPDVYALGDVNGRAMFAHACKRERNYVIKTIFEGKKPSIDFNLMPWAVFTSPPVAGIGLNETQALKKEISYGLLTSDFKRVGRAKIIEEQYGLVKVLYNKRDRQIIGATVMGPNADDIIHEFVALMNTKATITTLKRMIHIHPTLSEVMENLKEKK